MMAATGFKRYNHHSSFGKHERDAEGVIQELNEKMNRLKFRLLDCQNQNQMLRRELLLAKKVVNKEISPAPSKDFKNMLKQASGVGFRGRREKILLLKDKLNELQNRIKELEEDNVGKPPENPVIRPKTNKLEGLKEYQNRKMMDKELQHLLENSCQLKRKQEAWKKRNLELSKEVELLRLELGNLLEKSKEDRAVHESYRVVEKELRVKQTEKLDLRIKLDSERTRNGQLVEKIAATRKEISTIQIKASDDKVLIEALQDQQGHLRDLLERQKMISEGDNRRFRDDLRDLQIKHATNSNVLSQLHEIVSEKNLECERLQESTRQQGFVYGLECEEEQRISTAGGTTDSEQSHSSQQQSESQHQQSDSASDAPPNLNEDAPPEFDAEETGLMEECENHRNILRSLDEELDQLTESMLSNHVKLNEWMSKLFQTRSLLVQKSAEIHGLEEKVKELQKAASCSNKRGTASQQLGSYFTEEMSKTYWFDVLSDEAQFLVSLWEMLTSNKENSMEIYVVSIACTRKLFVDAVSKLILQEEEKIDLGEQLSQVENGDQSERDSKSIE